MKTLYSLIILTIYFCSPKDSLAQSGMALNLNGLDAYMEVEDHSDLDIDAGENFTITLWIKTSSSADFYRIVSKRTTGNGPGYEMITQAGVGAYGMNLRSVFNTNSGPPFGSTSITDGSWHHLAMVVNATESSARIFVDGNQEQMSSVSAIGTESFANNVAFLLGTNISQAVFMNGLLDDVRLWQTALSASEISDDMTASVSETTPDLIAAWDFESVSGNIVHDITGNHPGTLHGGAIIWDPDSPMQYSGTTLSQREMPAGMGEPDQGIISINVQTVGSLSPLTLNAVDISMTGTSDLDDVSSINIYATGNSNRFATGSLFGSVVPQSGTITVNGNQVLNEGNNFFWISYDVASNAEEGNLLDATCESLLIDGNEEELPLSSPTGSSPILLEHKALFSGGDNGSGFYRIPAITTIPDGSLVVLCDARINSVGDLPNNIDVVSKRSTNKGDTWSEAVVVADFGSDGAGDACMLTDRNTGNIVALFPSYNGFFQSTPNNRIRMQMVKSEDGGLSWSTPVDISDMVYGPGWYANFVTSGAMHQLRSGRIVAAAVVRPDAGASLDDLENYMIFSDDGGNTWDYMPNPASGHANEAKIVELDNGDIMMNIREFNNRKIVISEDGGMTWGTPYFQNDLIDPFVNGELIRYTSILDGYEKSRLLFSIAASDTRENMTVYLSYDEGQSWGISKVIYPGPAAYSALTILDDGTIGLFYENGEYETYQMYFARFSLEWLTDGADSWLPPVAINTVNQKLREITISPNPAKGFSIVHMDLQETIRLKGLLYNDSGLLVDSLFDESFAAGQHQKQIDLNSLPPGGYFIEVVDKNKAIVRKLLVIE